MLNHFAVQHAEPGERKGVDLDHGVLAELDEADIEIGHQRLDLQACPSIGVSTMSCCPVVTTWPTVVTASCWATPSDRRIKLRVRARRAVALASD